MLENMAEVFSCLRSCNVALRWLLLHTAASHRKLRAAVASAAPAPQSLLTLLLDTALLEYEVRIPFWPSACPEHLSGTFVILIAEHYNVFKQ